MANNINDAFAAFNAISNIIEREIKAIKTSTPPTVPNLSVDVNQDNTLKDYIIHQMDLLTGMVNEKMRELNVLVDQKINAFEQRMNEKLNSRPSVEYSAVRKITDAVLASVDNIEEKLNQLEEVASEPVIASEPIMDKSKEKEVVIAEVAEEEVAEAEEEVAEAEAEEEEEEEVAEEEEEAAEEEVAEAEAAEEEEEVAEEEEDELIEFPYKGKTYYMDSECNVYKLDDNGDLIEDPVGVYNESTRKITFNN